MARTELASQQVTPAGLEATYTAAEADGHFFENHNDRILHVVNASGVDVDVTVQTPVTKGGLAVADQVVTVTAGEDRFIGRFQEQIYNRDADEATDPDKVWVDFESVTSVTVALLEVV